MDRALKAYHNSDYTTAEPIFRKLAMQGNPEAQVGLGRLYNEGKGVPQDYVQAAFWYRKAAEQGSAAGQKDLGFLYEKGQGVPQDYMQADF